MPTTTERGTTDEAVHWAVVGGGMLGAAAADRLAASGASVVLYESAPSLGGLTSTWRLDVPGGEPVTWDRFYHVIVGNDHRLLRLLDELDVGPVVWGRTQAACFAGGRQYPASSGGELLALPFLSMLAKLRIAVTVAWGALWSSGARFDRLTAARWLRRWSGAEATERLWLPLLRAKLGGRAEEAAATFIWATIRRLVMARFQGGQSDQFGHVVGGYAAVLDAMAVRLRRRGVDVRMSSRVRRVARSGSGLEVVLEDGSTERYDKVLVTTAGPITARLCTDLTAAERERLDDVPYLGVICASVLLRRPAVGAYISYVTDPKPFTAVIEMTALVDPAELGGHHLVYLPRYTAPDDSAFDQPDEVIRGEFLGAFLPMYGLTDADVLSFSVARARLVLPVPTPGYLGRVPEVVTTVSGLYALGSSQIVDGTLNVEQTLKLLDDAWPRLRTTPDTLDPRTEGHLWGLVP
jgi:protoporphyrinogen oxidase